LKWGGVDDRKDLDRKKVYPLTSGSPSDKLVRVFICGFLKWGKHHFFNTLIYKYNVENMLKFKKKVVKSGKLIIWLYRYEIPKSEWEEWDSDLVYIRHKEGLHYVDYSPHKDYSPETYFIREKGDYTGILDRTLIEREIDKLMPVTSWNFGFHYFEHNDIIGHTFYLVYVKKTNECIGVYYKYKVLEGLVESRNNKYYTIPKNMRNVIIQAIVGWGGDIGSYLYTEKFGILRETDYIAQMIVKYELQDGWYVYTYEVKRIKKVAKLIIQIGGGSEYSPSLEISGAMINSGVTTEINMGREVQSFDINADSDFSISVSIINNEEDTLNMLILMVNSVGGNDIVVYEAEDVRTASYAIGADYYTGRDINSENSVEAVVDFEYKL